MFESLALAESQSAASTHRDAEPNAARNVAPEPCNVAPVPSFPCSLRTAAEFLTPSDVTLGRWAKSLADLGILVLNRAGQLTERGYGILAGFDAARAEGVTLADFAAAIAPQANQSSALAIQPEVVQHAGSHLARFSARQQQNQNRLNGLLSTIDGVNGSARTLREIQQASIRTQAQNDALEDVEVYLTEYNAIKTAVLGKLAEQAVQTEGK